MSLTVGRFFLHPRSLPLPGVIEIFRDNRRALSWQNVYRVSREAQDAEKRQGCQQRGHAGRFRTRREAGTRGLAWPHWPYVWLVIR